MMSLSTLLNSSTVTSSRDIPYYGHLSDSFVENHFILRYRVVLITAFFIYIYLWLNVLKWLGKKFKSTKAKFNTLNEGQITKALLYPLKICTIELPLVLFGIYPAFSTYWLANMKEYFVTVVYLALIGIFCIHVVELFIYNLPTVHILHHIFVFAVAIFGLEIRGYNDNLLLGRFIGISGYFFALDLVKNIGLTAIRVFQVNKRNVFIYQVCCCIDLCFKVLNTVGNVWFIVLYYDLFDGFLWFVAFCSVTVIPGAQFYMAHILFSILKRKKESLKEKKI